MKERRRHFFINKPLQLRYMAYFTAALVFISAIILASIYIGIWSSILDSFSESRIQNDLAMAGRLSQYEEARYPGGSNLEENFSTLSFFKQAEKLSQRQREIFKQILNETNRSLVIKLFFLLLFIAWSSVYLSHKIAGPFYRFQVAFKEIDKGNLTTRIHLRKYDEGQFLADLFNETFDRFENQIITLKALLKQHEKDPKLASLLQEELSKIKTRETS